MNKTIAAFISGAGSLSSGLVTNALARENAREQREWQEKMWLKQTAYNDPSAMAMRMRNAGLNPFTMTGAEPAGSAGTGASAETLPINNPFDSAVSTLRTFAEIDNINANTGKVETEIEKILKDVEYIDVLVEKGLIDVDTAKIYRDKLEPRLDAELEKIVAETRQAESSAAEFASRIPVNEAEARLVNAQGKSEEDLLPYRIALAEKDVEVNEALRLLYGVERVSITHESKREDALHPYRRAIMTLQERHFINSNTGQDIMNKINSAISDWYTGDNPPSPGVLAEKISSIVGDVLNTSIGFIFSPKKPQNKPFNKRSTTKRTFNDSKNMTQTTDVEYY